MPDTTTLADVFLYVLFFIAFALSAVILIALAYGALSAASFAVG